MKNKIYIATEAQNTVSETVTPHLELHPQLQYLSITLQHFHWYMEFHKPRANHQKITSEIKEQGKVFDI